MYLPHFFYQAACQGKPDLEGIPVIVKGTRGLLAVVADCSPEAEADGVLPGLTIEEASARCPGATVISLTDSSEVTWQKTILVLEGLTPKIEVEGIGRAYLDLPDFENDPREERNLGRQVIETIRGSLGLTARIGIGNSRFVARQAAVCAWDCLVIVPGDESDFLSILPMGALPVTEGEKKQFGLLGLTTVKKVASCSRQALIFHFGVRGGLVSDLARGIADTIPISPCRLTAFQNEEPINPAPSVTAISLRGLFEDLPCGMLAMAGA